MKKQTFLKIYQNEIKTDALFVFTKTKMKTECEMKTNWNE